MRETRVEQSLKTKTEKRGGMCYKLTAIRGIPDRLVILPDGIAAFVETKKPQTGRLSKIQIVIQRKIKRLGFQVHNVWDTKEVDPTLDMIQGLAPLIYNTHGLPDERGNK